MLFATHNILFAQLVVCFLHSLIALRVGSNRWVLHHYAGGD